MKNLKIGSLMLLVFLTLTVVTYNYQFHNIPYSMYLNAYKLPKSGFTLTLPKILPAEYMDVTNDTGFRVRVLEHVIACDIIRTGMKIKEYDIPYLWLKNAYNSSQGYDMTIKFYDDFYYLQVRYYPDFHRTGLEYGALWTINIVTVIAWFSFVVTRFLQRKPPLKIEEEKR